MSPLISSTRAAESPLSDMERSRYARHLTLPEVGVEGQLRLKASRVLCIGAGGLGSPVMTYLAAAGVGEIGVVDDDRVDFSNLQRQILHGTSDVGRLKTESGASRLAEINPGVRVARHETRFSATNAAAIAAPYDLIIDGTDNFTTRYLSNDLAVLTKKPNVYGSIHRFEGQVSVFAPHLGGPCYRCLFPDPPAPGMIPSCAEGGVLGILPGIIGAMQANEAVKLLLGIGDSLLHLAGELDPTMGGPSVPPNGSSKRRSLYFIHSRDEEDKFLTMFDNADILQCYRRTESIVPQQALALANAAVPLDAAGKIAQRIHASHPSADRGAFVDGAFGLLLGRGADPSERGACLEFWDRLAALDSVKTAQDPESVARSRLVHALLNHNDFVTVR
jgi:molybdopterin/thiamine biosynthesis adenylyltransferase